MTGECLLQSEQRVDNDSWGEGLAGDLDFGEFARNCRVYLAVSIFHFVVRKGQFIAAIKMKLRP